uniref:Uncharacterized protein n=1 Tax=Rhodosorus marinus TaxID=101924 RepID=A0A7S3A5C7_9RHOD|mmetsp:Transcript_44366/g.172491  ORF Transcript_44366/g.172491 Transcript_44366/m.172491 type:complete len:299 (+) Transcript_44366:182-1078(+)|eukprot:CAMPEP_0113964844 /NCGR_PEP_ID=MMETSP0011_2-20120614/7390_1 /TAXON_ID=101924 /ORGANISM="Rhodosorus marinus" /LENGTH=298 /DNA_ID=CAMNT_0000977241 /DNA_START=132 /DNA_END=1028 /DNA_ORIENTATION=+ /assembly_acc=CAM_ASM_000156
MAFLSSPKLEPGALKSRSRCGHRRVTVVCGKKLAQSGGNKQDDGGDKKGAPRVDANSSLGLKRQLWLVRENGKRASGGSSPVMRTSFRKKKEKTKATGKSALANGEIVDVPDGKYNKNSSPILFIDGYNVIGYWPKLKKKRDKNDLPGARKLLNEEVSLYSGLRGWECVIVYDAMQSERKGLHIQVEDNITVVFTGNDTADSYIEFRTKECAEENIRQVWAATSDYLQQKMAFGNGAHLMSANLLVQELKRTKKEASVRLQKHNRDMDRDKIGLIKYAFSDEQRQKFLEEFGGDEIHF